ncbi:MAG: dephospho-CoA kinase [Helicobacter sp.]|nr:dephospho-CoA kinase [Helicobacter sp.]
MSNAIILTGGIAAGKSSASNILKSLGFSIIDADAISHKALEQMEREVIAVFGSNITINGKISRPKLGKLIFNNKKLKLKLESILHPLIFAQIKQEQAILEAQNKPFFIDIPIFFEIHGWHIFNFRSILCIICEPNIQLIRLFKRGLSFHEAKSRMKSQLKMKQKAKMSDFVIQNNASFEDFTRQIRSFAQNL